MSIGRDFGRTPFGTEAIEARKNLLARDAAIGENRDVPVETPSEQVSAVTDADGVIRIVETSEYAARKGAGIAAPYPGRDVVDLAPWGSDEHVFYRESDDDDWVELVPLEDGETFPLPPGSSVKLVAPRRLTMEMW